MYKFSLLSR